VPNPAVLFGGPSPEHDVSILTGLQAARALGAATAIYWAKTGDFFEVDPAAEGKDFLDGPPRKAPQLRLVAGEGFVGKKRPLDLGPVVNCCHGGPGEDGTIQAALDLAGIRYTGPTVAGAALGMDKLAFGNVVAAAGLPSLPRAAFTADGEPPAFAGPYIVKPRYGGSSIGIEVVEDVDTARALATSSPHLRNGVVVEPYRGDAYDLNVGVRSWPALELSMIEKPVRSTGGGILGFADKYLAAGGEGGMASAPRELPAVLPEGMEKQVRDMARQVAELAGVRGVARIDFLVDGDELWVNEINTIPGSLGKYLWDLSFRQLLGDLLAEAEQRPTHQYSAVGADGTALRSAGSIAGKLG
jgi:D-alanine-D-alanine ligase